MSASCSPACTVCREVATRRLPPGIRWLPQRHKFQGRYSLKGVVYSAGVFDKQREAERALREAMREGRPAATRKRTKREPRPEDLTLAELLGQYMAERDRIGLNPSTRNVCQTQARLLAEVLGALPVQGLRTMDVERCWRALMDPTRPRPTPAKFGRVNAVVSPKTAKMCVEFLQQVLAWALKRGIVATNVAMQADKPKVPAYEARPLSLDEARALLAVLRASDDPYADVVGVSLYTTLRGESELLGASEADMDLERGVYHLRTVLTAGELRPAGNNKNHVRAVPLMPPAQWFLKRHLEYKRRMSATWAAKEAPLSIRADERLFFRSPYGRRMNPEELRARFKSFLAAAGIDQSVRFHDLRHTGVVLLFEMGLSVPEVAAMTGHRAAHMLLGVYARVMPNAAVKASALLAQGLG